MTCVPTRRAQVRRCVCQRASFLRRVRFRPRRSASPAAQQPRPSARCGDGIVQTRRAVRRRQSASPATAAKPTARMTPSPPAAAAARSSSSARTRRDPPLASGICAGHRGQRGAAHHRRHRARARQGLPRRPGARRRRPASSSASTATARGNAAAAGATTIACPTGVVSPGLINTHDHITYAQNVARRRHRRALRAAQRLAPRPARPHQDPVDARRDGRRAPLGRAALPHGRRHLRDRLGRHAPASCATSTSPRDQDGLVSKHGRRLRHLPARHARAQLSSGCAYTGFPSLRDDRRATSPIKRTSPRASTPPRTTSSSASRAPWAASTSPRRSTSFIHAVGLAPADYQKMAQTRTSLIWSPRSNIRLYGDTAHGHRRRSRSACRSRSAPTGCRRAR